MYCRQCGSQIADDSKFCSQCGAVFSNTPSSRHLGTERNSRICCPMCGNKNLHVTTDRDWGAAVLGGVTGTVIGGLGSGALNAASNLQQQTFFVCHNCGHRFRRPEELAREAQLYGKRSKGINIACVILIALCVILMSVGIKTNFIVITVLFGFLAAILILCIVFMRAKANKPKKELEEIKQGMAKFL